ncbi:HK97 family phage prohead protease [Nitrobacter sp.]|uniref:HK97 family phage prohead protease n=1 Tax=Nitrobacter sp. TaxID=29420 RepID=UPI0029CAAF12|nr:HK97 family phage prohead protease [Nitrobacter sp.]
MDEVATLIGDLELRAARNGRRRLRGRFPYKKRAVLSDGGRKGGRPQKEEFASRAFGYRVQDQTAEIHLLVGHSYDKPLASKLTNTLHLVDSDEALTFDAEITPEIADTSYGADILKQIDGGLSVGISPGFRLPPPRAVAKPEVYTDEGHDPARNMHNARIRTILQALLYELSIVTVPAYKLATVTADTMSDAEKIAVGWVYDADGVLVDPATMSDADKIAAGWTWQNGILVPPPQSIIKRAMPAALRWR